MPNTTKGLPYPLPTDPVASGAANIQALAEGVDSRLAIGKILDYVVAGSVLATFDTQVILGGALPTVYRHLMLVMKGRHDAAVTQGLLHMRYNADSAANYDFSRYENSSASTMIAAEGYASGAFLLGRITGASAPAGGNTQLDAIIGDYNDTVFWKMFRSNSACMYGSASGQWTLNTCQGQWRSAAAINRIQVFPASGNFIIGTRFTLYGLY